MQEYEYDEENEGEEDEEFDDDEDEAMVRTGAVQALPRGLSKRPAFSNFHKYLMTKREEEKRDLLFQLELPMVF